MEDELAEIEYSEAIKIEPDFEVGDEVAEVVNISSFGRREILAIRQNLQTKIMEYEKENIYLKYKDKVGEVVNVEVSQSWRKEIIAVDEEGIELTTYCDSSCSSLLFLLPHEAIKKTTDNDSKLTINDFANFFIFFLLFEVQN